MDVHASALPGSTLAEVELEREGQEVELPSWLGRQVMLAPRLWQSAMLRLTRGANRDVTLAEVLAAQL